MSVRLSEERLPLGLFGTHVGGGAEMTPISVSGIECGGPLLVRCSVENVLRQSEIQDLDGSVRA